MNVLRKEDLALAKHCNLLMTLKFRSTVQQECFNTCDAEQEQCQVKRSNAPASEIVGCVNVYKISKNVKKARHNFPEPKSF